MSYCIISGWFADRVARDYPTKGDDFVRSVECFHLWYHCIQAFTSPSTILIVDSASVLRPALPQDSWINWLPLQRNFGHAAQGLSRLSGWSRALLCGLGYGFSNGDLYTVLIEQGTLFCGQHIIERQILAHPDADIIAPSGAGTPQPLQTGILIFRNAIVPRFIQAYTQIPEGDQLFSPEKKVMLAAAGLNLQLSALPFGRRRPIDCALDHFFLRHVDSGELRRFVERLGFGADLIASAA